MKRVFVAQESFSNLQLLTPEQRRKCAEALEKFLTSDSESGLSPVKAGDVHTFALDLGGEEQGLIRKFEDTEDAEASSWILTAIGKKSSLADLAKSIRFAWDGETVRLVRVIADSGKLDPERPLARFGVAELVQWGVPQESITKIQAVKSAEELQELEGDLPPLPYFRLLQWTRTLADMPAGILVLDEETPKKELADLEKEMGQVLDDLFHSDRFCLLEKKEQVQAICQDNAPVWLFFPLPDQKKWVTRNFKGPVLVRGVPGSGKTVTALLRARYLAEEILQDQDGDILVISPVKTNVDALKETLSRLKGIPADRIEVQYIFDWARAYLEQAGEYKKSDHANFLEIMKEAIDSCRQGMPNMTPSHLDFNFVRDEIALIIKGRGLHSQPDYLALPRRGFGTPLSSEEKRHLWRVYLKYQSLLESQNLLDREDLLVKVFQLLPKKPPRKKYVAAILDDTQDLPPIALKIFHQLVQNRPNGLFMLSDVTQKFMRGGEVISNLGIELCIRPPLLRANMRNTAEIVDTSFKVLENTRFEELDSASASPAIQPEVAKCGLAPQFQFHDTEENEVLWIQELLVQLTSAAYGFKPGEILLLARTNRYLTFLEVNLSQAQIPYQDLRRSGAARDINKLQISSYLDCRGLESPVVILTEVVDGTLPAIPAGIDSEELASHLSLERRLLACAMNRAQEMLFISGGGGVPSRFVTSLLPASDDKGDVLAEGAESSAQANSA